MDASDSKQGLLVFLLALCSVTAACTFPVRLGIGPCVDTRGNPGVDVSLSVGIGFGDEHGSAQLSGIVGTGVGGPEAATSLAGGAELGWEMFFGSPKQMAGRAGLLFSSRNLYEDDEIARFLGLGANAGFAYVLALPGTRNFLRGSRFQALSIGLLVQGEVLWQAGEPVGWFTFPVFLELLTSM